MVGPLQVASTLGDPFVVVARKLSRAQSKHSQSLDALKEVVVHLLDLHAPATEPVFSFVSSTMVFPSGLPSK